MSDLRHAASIGLICPAGHDSLVVYGAAVNSGGWHQVGTAQLNGEEPSARIDFPGLACVLLPGAVHADGGAPDIDWNLTRWSLGGRELEPWTIPPLDVASTREVAELSVIAGATVSAQYTLEGAPFGDLDFYQHFEDGRLLGSEVSWSSEADVYVTIPWRRYLELRCGAVDPFDAAAHGSLTGEMERMSVLGGIVGSAPFEAARRANGPVVRALLEWDEIVTPEMTRDALRVIDG